MTNCKICNHPSERIFSKVILKKYNADYFRCTHCGFVQTSEPVWLDEAYQSAITSLDIGLIGRNISYSGPVAEIIDACFPEARIMLDYAGGYGMFVRLMRDLGYNFYRQDIYCDNIFAKHFDLADLKQDRFNLVTAFEVFEHFVNPLKEIDEVFKYADDIIFSTEMLPSTVKEIEDWWYISQETGQHVSFYTPETLAFIAKKYNKYYYSRFNSLHLFSSHTLSKDQTDYAFGNIRTRSSFFGLIKQPLDLKIKRKSLTDADYNFIKGLISK